MRPTTRRALRASIITGLTALATVVILTGGSGSTSRTRMTRAQSSSYASSQMVSTTPSPDAMLTWCETSWDDELRQQQSVREFVHTHQELLAGRILDEDGVADAMSALCRSAGHAITGGA